jgi:AraC-like DNA-binding protein
MSVNSFIRTFREETGMTPMRFVRQLIARRAIEMLAYSDLTQAEIAKRLNFQDLHSFSRYFRRETGSTPGNYRCRNREPRAGKNHTRPE